jgi:hypothetical protein
VRRLLALGTGSSSAGGRIWQSRLLLGLALMLIVVLSLWARGSVPVRVNASLTHDDLLFARQAGALLDGRWLGTFDTLTLAKGPGYPLFVAAAYELGLPLKLAEHLLQLVAAALLGLGAGRLTGRPLLGVVLFAVAALGPAHLGEEAARLNRTGLYSSASTALLGASLLAASLARRRQRGVRDGLAVASTGLAAGGSAWLCFITREERVTLLPPLLAVGLAALWAAGGGAPRRTWRQRREIGLRLVPVLAVGVVAAGTMWVGIALVEHRNGEVYGVPLVTDTADGAFPALYAALTAVDVGEPRRYVPISREQREAAYAASPAFARVGPELEGWGSRWIEPGCEAVGVCDDYAAGWVTWAVRGAVLRALGDERTAAATQQLMRTAADEVAAGCGRDYPCRTVVVSFLPELSQLPVREALGATARATAQVLSHHAPGYRATPGTSEQHDQFVRVVRGLPSGPAAAERAAAHEGWWPAGLRALFAVLTWAALAPAVVGLLWWRDHGQRSLQVLGGVLAVAAATRIVLVALVDVTSFPAVGTGYLLPAADPTTAVVVVGVASLVTMGVNARSGWGPRAVGASR